MDAYKTGVSGSSETMFKSLIADYLNIPPQDVLLFWKGRVALYAILKAIGIKEGDEVILPAFTCVVAVNPIIYLGAKPVYVDVDPMTYNLNPLKIEKKITAKTKAILAQNTFGLAPDLDKIFKIANKHDLKIIEDCAHGFGGFYKGKPNGTIADVSFFSTQWNKPFSTGLGGFAVTKNPEIAENLRIMEKSFARPSAKDEMILKTLLFVRGKLGTGLYWPAIKTYRWLSKKNLILGSSQGEELESPVKPEGFEKGFSGIQSKRGGKELESIDKILEHRKNIAALYKEILLDMQIEPPYEPDYAVHTYLKFPLLVKDRMKFFKLAEKEKIELGDWFLSPIHPITKNFELWHYKWGGNPFAEKISRHIVNLPTHTKIDEDYVGRIALFLEKNRNEIYGSYEEMLK